MDQIIYLDADDNIATTREKLARAQSGRVALVVPAASLFFRNLVNLKLLQRFAAQDGLQVTLITGDRATRALAAELHLPAKASLGTRAPASAPTVNTGVAADAGTAPAPSDSGVAAETGTGPAPAAPAAAPPSIPPAPLPGPRPAAARPAAAAPATAPLPRRQAGRLAGLRPRTAPTTGRRIFGYALLLVFLTAVGFGVLLLVPDATVDLTPASEVVSRVVTVKAGADVRTVDVARGQVPARLLQVTLQDVAQIDTTGRRQEPAQRASGRVVFTNRSGSAVNVPQGTGVRTGTGTLTRFLTSAAATVAANGFTQVPIVAELPGSGGNLPAWSISQVEGSLSFALSVVNDTPTSGGTEQQAQLVSAADRVRLRDTLYANMKDAVAQAVRAELKPGESMLSNEVTIRVEEESFDREVNEVAKSVGLRMRMSASALAVPSDGLKKLAEAALEGSLTDGAQLIRDSVTVGPPQDMAIEGASASFRFEASGTGIIGLDSQQVRRDIQGLTVAQAEQLLLKRYRLNRDPDITLRNGWLGRLPLMSFRIQVVLSAS